MSQPARWHLVGHSLSRDTLREVKPSLGPRFPKP